MNYITNIARSKSDPKVLQAGPSSISASDRLARQLGWFSIALGIAELVAARRISRGLGVRGSEGLIRACGVREIGSGILSLSIDKKAGLLSRVAGDALDIAALVAAMRLGNRKRGNVAVALMMVAGVTLLDIAGAQAVSARHSRRRGEIRDFGDRSGFSAGVNAARGLARKYFQTPSDMQATLSLPYEAQRSSPT